MGLGLRAAVQGRLMAGMEAEIRAVDGAITGGVAEGTTALKLAARNEVVRGFGGGKGARRAGNAIRSRLYDDGKFKATGIVYSKLGRKGPGGAFIDYLLPHTRGAVLKAKRAKYLVIPVKGTSRRVKKVFRSLARLDEDPQLALIPQRYGFLFVRRTRTRTTLIARLVRQVRLKKRLDFDTLIWRETQALAGRILRRMEP